MTYAAITGWGKCLPPAVLTNADLSTFLDTSDEWIVSRTGMKERRVSHVSAIQLASTAAARAPAPALVRLEKNNRRLVAQGLLGPVRRRHGRRQCVE